jgi:hypothetical protein
MKLERRSDDIVRAFLLERMLKDQGWTQPGSTTPFNPSSKRPSQNRNRAPHFPDRDELRAGAASGPVFAGEVTGLVGGGMFVAFGPDLHFEGFIPLRELKEARGGFWNLNEFQTALVDDRSGHQIQIGAEVEVAVLSLQTARARVDLLPVTI